MTFDDDEFAPVIGKWIVHSEASAGDAGDLAHCFLDLAIEGHELGGLVGVGWIVERDDDASGSGIAEVLMFKFIEAAGQHNGAGDKNYGDSGLENEKSLAGEGRIIARAPAGAAEGFDGIGTSGEPSRRSTEDSAGEERDSDGEEQNGRRWGDADGKEMGAVERETKQQSRGDHGDQ